MWDAVVNQQAQVIAYVNDYVLMIFVTLPALVLLFFMRHHRVRSVADERESSVPVAD